ncbi:MAG: DUF1592 domain-containing protein [Verrucomicrobiales bacterium]|nr:DUF1592 domain-containing protein [Verrucomicrobiales bacterium]
MTSPSASSRNLLLAAAAAFHTLAPAADFQQEIEPILIDYCFDCHSDGVNKGDFAMDEWDDLEAHTHDREHWLPVWKNLRSQMMPPADKNQPSSDQVAALTSWIETAVFELDPENPDPGRVTVRRLNRLEYKNTVRDLLGIDFKVEEEFPADDTGYGFDTIGDVLSISPLLMEKYLAAAETIAKKVVYTDGPFAPTTDLWANSFKTGDGERNAEHFSFDEHVSASREFHNAHPGPYKITVDAKVEGSAEASDHAADLILRLDGEEIARHPLGWDNSETIGFTTTAHIPDGNPSLSLEVIPKRPPAENQKPLHLKVRKLEFHGPTDGSHLIYPDDYTKFFTDGPPPPAADKAGRDAYARKLLTGLASRAFRRPADKNTLDRLGAIVQLIDGEPGHLFEHGIQQAMIAILASPRFLFRAEAQPEPDNPDKIVNIDEHSLASRLSYFLWSSMPDQQLFDLAAKGELRKNLCPQVDRMLADNKSDAFISSFVGQWLQTRDVLTLPIDPRRVLRIRDRREAERVFNYSTRRAMRNEIEMLFEHVVKENKPLLDLIDPDYTFMDERLADFYDMVDYANELELKRDKFQKVTLPEGSVRGGILTAGSTLVVTSNPTRTSPVKRGLFILDNILGTPAPPAPPDVPELREAADEIEGEPTMRKLMELHREKPLCNSCHQRMDPIGLAMDNFNAIGQWRDDERGEPIDGSGKLITGEEFQDIRELKKAIATTTGRRTDFYRCITEKLLTYALGRGTEYYDSTTIDHIIANLEKDGGHFKTLLYGVIEAPAFQKRRGDN